MYLCAICVFEIGEARVILDCNIEVEHRKQLIEVPDENGESHLMVSISPCY